MIRYISWEELACGADCIQITEEYAKIEGEGDKSLEYWREVHWNYYTREMQSSGEKPSESMILLCEYFEAIWK